jgi:hypothetical protein
MLGANQKAASAAAANASDDIAVAGQSAITAAIHSDIAAVTGLANLFSSLKLCDGEMQDISPSHKPKSTLKTNNNDINKWKNK